MHMQAPSSVECNDAETMRAVARAIHQRTWKRIANLRVESRGEVIVIHGSTPTYYLKQLAVEAAREVLATTRQFLIEIDVT
jgi:hypothetical protein